MTTSTPNHLPALRRLVIEPTYTCNLRCSHCYVLRSARAAGRTEDLRQKLPPSFWEAVLAELPAGIAVHFTGGEVFAYPGIFTILEAAAIHHPVSLVTNGALLSETDCIRLCEANPTQVTISLHGDPATHDTIAGIPGTFEKACRTLEWLAHRLPPDRLSANFVLLPENWHLGPWVSDLLARIGVARLVVQLFDPAVHRCGVTAGRRPIPAAQPLDWSAVDARALVEVLAQLQDQRDEPAVLLASEMSPQEIVASLYGELDLGAWQCDEVFDTMRCSPGGHVYTCTGELIGQLNPQAPTELWESELYTSFRRKRSGNTLDPSCVGCCKIRRKDERIRQ